MSKARDLADSAQEINILDGKSFLDEDNLASDSATGIASQQSIKAYVDGITTTNITSTGALNSGSITSGFGNIDNGSSTITTTGAITGGSFVIGSADINENDLESIDGITAGTVSASKAVVVNTNKDITGFRNLTATGTITGSLSGTLSGSLSSTTTATTQAESDDSTKIATTAYVTDKITTLIGGAPSTLNDLNELAAAINDDANYNSTLTTALATKLPLAGGTMTGDVLYNDNIKAKFGAGDDLNVWHNGSHSYVQDTGTGNLYLAGSNVIISNPTATETMAYFDDDGGASLWYDNSVKLATTSTGVDVTGQVIVDGGTGVSSSGVLHVRQNGDGEGNGIAITSSNTTSHRIWKDANGKFNIGPAGSPSAFVQDLSGNVGIGTISPSSNLHLKSSTSGDPELRIEGSGTDNGIITFLGSGHSNPAVAMRYISSGDSVGHLGFYANGSSSSTLSERMRIKSDGNLQLNGQLHFTDTGSLIARPTTNALSFNTNGSERMRVDASGNVLVGKTSTAIGTVGTTLGESGFITATRSGNPVLNLNRTSSDGPIADFYRGDVLKGSINIFYSNLMIGKESGARISFGDTDIYSTNNAGSTVDNAYDLGSTNSRFRECHAVNYYGDGSNLTGVGGSTAYGAVGTYFLGALAANSAYHLTQGDTTSGSNLRVNNSGSNRYPADEYYQNIGSAGLSGTWRLMCGHLKTVYTSDNIVGLWVRIS